MGRLAAVELAAGAVVDSLELGDGVADLRKVCREKFASLAPDFDVLEHLRGVFFGRADDRHELLVAVEQRP